MCDSQFCDSQQQFGCTNMSTISSSTVAESSTASVMIAKRERRLRLEKVGSYRVGRVLGRGNFAQVRIAYHEIANAKVAMKIVDKQSLDTENLTKIEREIKILQKLNHPFIVKLYEVIRTNRYLYIVMEYVSNGELFDMLMDGGRQTEIESRRIFQQIVSAVAYCHSNEIVHRDLKAENLLLDKKGNIKLIDFGFSNYQQPSQLLSTWCGSPPYAAPELLLAQEYDGHLSDVWSLGVILYILVTAGFPFPGDSVEKLKRAVLSDHLKIPFWVSVECADLIRKMLTISPAKRYNLQQVVQHRWFCAGKMPEQIKMLLMSSLNKEQTKEESVTILTPRPTLDPTVLVFMQQHTGWSDEQISEEVLTNNYESPIFATYELLLARLSEFRSAEAAAAALINNNISTGTFAGIGTNFVALENEQTRRGSRGSIISGKANIAQNETQCATIPTHHLAKLSLSTSPDYDSDDSDSTNDLVESMSNDDFTSLSSSLPFMQSQHAQQRSPNIYKSSRRVYRRSQTIAEKNQLLEQQQILNRQRFPYTLEYQQLNPLLNAVAQQFAVDTTRAWANAAAAAALFASQIQQQNNNGGSSSETAALQQAAALNLVSLQNFPFVDYARMIHVPNQERRASANEALLGLNSYAHLLAACSTMGVGSGGGTGSGGPDTRCSSSQGTSSSPRQGPSTQSHRSSCHQQSRRSVEEEGESYLIGQRGANKRNTVHSITNGLPILGGQGTSSLISGSTFQQRHNRTMPYFKQILGDERRSSWASSCSPSFAASSVAATAAALAINAQQQAQLERLYKQSIAQANAAAVGATAAESTASSALSSVQQLQLEFQKLYASTKEGSPGGASACVGNSPNSLFIGGLMNVDQGPLFMKTALVQQQIQHQQQMPTINITDENNQNIESLETNSLLSKTDSNIVGGELPFSQQSTLSNVLSGIGNPSTLGISQTDIGNNQTLKFVYIPICIETAIQRLQKFVQNRQLLCEVQCDELKGKLVQNVNSVRIRIATSSSNEFINNKSTIVELILYRIDQSPNISKALFTHIQGEDINEYEQLRINLLSIFNEVF